MGRTERSTLCPGAFEISWHDNFGYRVSVPRLLEESERLTVVPLSEYEAVVRQRDEALDALKTTDSWLWNKVVNGIYGPVGEES